MFLGLVISVLLLKIVDFDGEKCRGSKIRTCDLLLPKQARYRATLYPEKRFANLKKFYISKPKNFFILRRDGDSNPGYPVRGTLV